MIKNKKGITLIALVVTIIALLVLSGISLSLTLGENGVLSKAKLANQEYKSSEIIEETRMDITGKQVNNLIETKIYFNDLTEILKKYYTQESVDVIQSRKINNENYRKNTKVVTQKHGGIEISLERILEGYKIKIPTFDFYGKEPHKVVKGDRIAIGPEEFVVIRNTRTKLTVLPIYNITLDENSPEQSESAQKSKFSTACYWSSVADTHINAAIDMEDERNCIQKYIKAYANTLKSYGLTNFNTRVPLRDDMWRSDMTAEKRNPEKDNSYWCGTSSDGWPGTSVVLVPKDGNNVTTSGGTGKNGVRPVIDFNIPFNGEFNTNNLTIGTATNTDKYGWKVKNYNVTTDDYTSGIWRLFYQDSVYTYLITDGYISKSDWSNYRWSKYPNGTYISDIARKLNPKMKNMFEDNSFMTGSFDGLRFTAYLGDATDEGLWEDYKNEDAIFAIASPTLELFAASFNSRSNKSNTLTVEMETYGYDIPSCGLNSADNHGIYCKSPSANNSYWVFASPYGKYSSSQIAQRYTYFERMSTNAGYGFIITPIVCIPTSVFNEKYGTTENLVDE